MCTNINFTFLFPACFQGVVVFTYTPHSCLLNFHSTIDESNQFIIQCSNLVEDQLKDQKMSPMQLMIHLIETRIASVYAILSACVLKWQNMFSNSTFKLYGSRSLILILVIYTILDSNIIKRQLK